MTDPPGRDCTPSCTSATAARGHERLQTPEAGNTGMARAGNSEKISIKAHLPPGPCSTSFSRPGHAGAGSGGGRRSAISRRISTNSVLGTVTSDRARPGACVLLLGGRAFLAAPALLGGDDSHAARRSCGPPAPLRGHLPSDRAGLPSPHFSPPPISTAARPRLGCSASLGRWGRRAGEGLVGAVRRHPRAASRRVMSTGRCLGRGQPAAARRAW